MKRKLFTFFSALSLLLGVTFAVVAAMQWTGRRTTFLYFGDRRCYLCSLLPRGLAIGFATYEQRTGPSRQLAMRGSGWMVRSVQLEPHTASAAFAQERFGLAAA